MRPVSQRPEAVADEMERDRERREAVRDKYGEPTRCSAVSRIHETPPFSHGR
jgi:hypothetical protein